MMHVGFKLYITDFLGLHEFRQEERRRRKGDHE